MFEVKCYSTFKENKSYNCPFFMLRPIRENPLKRKTAPDIMKATPTYGFCPPKIPNANVWDKMTLFVPLKGLTRNSVNHRKIISLFHFNFYNIFF